MTMQYTRDSEDPRVIYESPERRTVASYKRELIRHRRTESGLRRALARDEALLSQKDELIRQQVVLGQESDHRLLNGLQMIMSLLSLQSGASANAETASQLAIAADRVGTIGRIHRHLHAFDGAQTFAFKQYLADLCRDLSIILSSERSQRTIVVEGMEVTLPIVTAIPLGFIANEMITNAAKYGTGRITVKLEPNPVNGYALSVANEGGALSEGFDPTAGKGLGMRIIRSLVGRIGGELRIDPGDVSKGARFTVLFA